MTAASEEACARTIVEDLAARAYRRPLQAGEADELLALYGVGREDATFAAGIATVIEAVLQSPDFLYRVEWGAPDPARYDLGPARDIGPLRVLAYNVQCALCNGEFIWPFRLRAMVPMLESHRPDLFAAQELLTDYDALHLHMALPRVDGRVVYEREAVR